MDISKNNQPRKITDSYDCVCNFCGKTIYKESIIGILQDDGFYKYTKLTVGTFTQDSDSEGNVTGPIIPTCYCRSGE